MPRHFSPVRLAPEHPITTAVKDSLDAVTVITQNPAAFNATSNQFIIGGHAQEPISPPSFVMSSTHSNTVLPINY